ncbi:protein-glutamate methylesterase/protein-glutamine glutaminase [Lacimicrobium alkaliphilum]|uniref:Protein-glutamate methylesterase/protein-glutamine glutaminase n=1 Tax=Lacimicrobium alkaliphilum TaxID=1526571 RepID=A0ABQ1R850_9ALTE|nr:chemotaxis response regulator protein-glutamate methylesterase [Lacimicrobium alkaliphilum]GGD57824.1 chemotaxis response regulator protein-glutamate methylesterase [Lacimicrobium alkaliphilum]
MQYKVLVVDDSTFFRKRVADFLEQDPGLTVVGQARNGQEAIDMAASLSPDVITMDVEMPVMDGITAVKKIMAQKPVPILMFSSLTHDGAEATLNALDAGALDFLPKKFEDIARERTEAISLLQQRVKALARRRIFARPATSRPVFRTPATETQTPRSTPAKAPLKSGSGKRYAALAIGASTGGPVALQTVLTELPASFSYPIFLIQHMPGTFTSAFAARMNNLCKINVKEAENGEIAKPGWAYLAPGGKQMLFEGTSRAPRIRIVEDKDQSNITYKPSVDLSFASLARIYGGDVLAVILTGMGADGREGARSLKSRGASIWAQDEKTCVVYGMPQAVAAAGISSESMPLGDIAANIKTEMSVRG